MKPFFQIHVGNSCRFGYYFWLFKIATRKHCWVSVMDFYKFFVKYYWV